MLFCDYLAMAKPMLCLVFGGLSSLLLAAWLTGSFGAYISNLNDSCYRCLCHVVGCDLSHECTGGYCGPFNISRVYWIDSGRRSLPQDDPDRNHAFEDCARNYHCSLSIIGGYLERFAKDCNGDGVTDCYDYMMINGNGGYGCSSPLNRSANGRRWLARFAQCHF